jgi:hypothetical protein
MPRSPRLARAALHIGVGNDPRFSPLPKVEIAIDRIVGVSAHSGMDHQVVLRDEQATAEAVRNHVGWIAAHLSPTGLFVLSFAGHGGQIPDASGYEIDGKDETWHLWAADLVDDEIGGMLSLFPVSTRIVVVSDSCHSGGVVDFQEHNVKAPVTAAQVVLISACHDDQRVVDIDIGRLAGVIDTTVFPGGTRDRRCTYAKLATTLSQTTTPASRATVTCNRGELPDQAAFL